MKFYMAIFLFLAGMAAAQESQVQRTKFELVKIEQFEEIKANEENYIYGETIASIQPGENIQEVFESSQKKAVNNLAQKIEMTVKGDIKKVIIVDETGGDEKIRGIFEQKIELYTGIVLEDVKSDYIKDYPDNGVYTFFAYILRKKYEEKVNEDLKNNKMFVTTPLNEGIKEFEKGNYMLAADHWINSKNFLYEFFGELPVREDIKGSGKFEELHSFLDNRMSGLFGHVTISPLVEEKYSYDNLGNLASRPKIVVHYKDQYGNKKGFGNLPLKVDFVRGEGRLAGPVKTSEYGEVELPLEINPATPDIILNIKIDTEKLEGIENFNLPSMPELRIDLSRMKTIALSVAFYNQSKKSVPDDLLNEIKNKALSSGYNALEFELRDMDVTEQDKKDAENKNADYLLVVLLNTSGSGNVGGYKNMFSTNISGEISLYKLPPGNQVGVETVDTTRGMGNSGEAAGWHAYGKVKNQVEKKAGQIIEGLR